LNNLRKNETNDPNHKWIGTYNLYLVIISTFFKWLYYPKTETKERRKPEVIKNLKRLKRKEKSAYKPTDMWTQDDDLLFLKYCPSKRDRCYHAISRDSSCRPHELLKLKIKDVVFKMSGNRQYAEIFVDGRTGTRAIPLINSLPYVKDMLDIHPQKNNPNACLIYNERVFSIFSRGLSIYGLFHLHNLTVGHGLYFIGADEIDRYNEDLLQINNMFKINNSQVIPEPYSSHISDLETICNVHKLQSPPAFQFEKKLENCDQFKE
jgi:hypothetical protein